MTRQVPRYLGAKKPKRKDYCSRWPDHAPDGTYYGQCCQKHDLRYATPGDRHDRAKADRELRDCITAHAGPFWGWTMWLGVRVCGGLPWHYSRTIFMRKLDDEELEARFDIGGAGDA